MLQLLCAEATAAPKQSEILEHDMYKRWGKLYPVSLNGWSCSHLNIFKKCLLIAYKGLILRMLKGIHKMLNTEKEINIPNY